MQILLSIPFLPSPKNTLHSYSYLILNTLHKTAAGSTINNCVRLKVSTSIPANKLLRVNLLCFRLINKKNKN